MAKKPYIPPLIGWLYDLVLWTFSVLVDLFFREVHPRGSWKVPRRGPMIIVAAPHANQVREYNVHGNGDALVTESAIHIIILFRTDMG